jgi:hypothetical protein
MKHHYKKFGNPQQCTFSSHFISGLKDLKEKNYAERAVIKA